MNCKQIQESLPLYVGGELEERRAQSVALHLQSCADCAGIAGEYFESRELLKEFHAPVFSESVYAGIRSRVLREIESESAASGLWQVPAGFFRPRPAWALASVLLIAVAAGIYFIANRRSASDPAPKSVAVSPIPSTPPVKTGIQSAPQRTTGPNAFSSPSKATPVRHRLQRHTHPNVIIDPANSVAANTLGVPSTTNSDPVNSVGTLPAADSTAAKTLRMEMQTKDPNVRIIWFAQQQEPKRAPSNSKGI